MIQQDFVSNKSVYGKRYILLGRDISEERMSECIEMYD